jgi:GDP-L-fucose synthase
MSYFSGKKVLVTGGTGLIGRPLVDLLLDEGANLQVVSLDEPIGMPKEVHFLKVDLREYSNCVKVCKGQDIVFQLAGVKGSPAMTLKRPASFYVPTITFNTNMMEAARQSGVARYLYTSSVGVYSPAEVFHEDDVWKTFPSPNDRFAGWAKRMGELQAQAYQIEYDWQGISIVRPANVYGPYDNFNPYSGMVIPSLIQRISAGENPLKVWGDGSPVRDFIHARDVARGMMLAVEKKVNEPINLGSGEGVSIKKLVEIIVDNMREYNVSIEWDITKPKGDAIRIMDMARANRHGFRPSISIENGIKETVQWFLGNKEQIVRRYDAFTDKAYTAEKILV